MTFLELVHMDAKLIWDGEAHRARSITKAERFASFSDYETRGIGDYKPSHIHRFFDSLAEQGLSNNTINHYGAMIVKVFGHAVSEEHISHVPKFKYRKVKGNKRPLYFTKSQIDLMSAYFRNSADFRDLEFYLIIGIHTGMRIGEIRSINESTLVIDETGGYSVYLADTKNGDSRTIPITNVVKVMTHTRVNLSVFVRLKKKILNSSTHSITLQFCNLNLKFAQNYKV